MLLFLQAIYDIKNYKIKIINYNNNCKLLSRFYQVKISLKLKFNSINLQFYDELISPIFNIRLLFFLVDEVNSTINLTSLII